MVLSTALSWHLMRPLNDPLSSCDSSSNRCPATHNPACIDQRSVDLYFDDESGDWIGRYVTEAAFTARLQIIAPVVLESVRASRHGRVLDFGGGAGVFSAVASGAASMVLTLDRSFKMLDAARVAKYALADLVSAVGGTHKPERVFQVAGDIRVLPRSADGFFDVVMAISVLEYIDDVETAFAHLARLLDRGGVMILQVPNPRSPWRWARSVSQRLGRPATYAALRPHGNRPPWRRAIDNNDLVLTAVQRVPQGLTRPRKWFNPNLLVILRRLETERR